MITNRGKDIIARYLAGQTISAFSYLAIGVGSRPAVDNEEPATILSRKNLDFEALRVPITSSSVISEAGQTTLVFSATLPSQSRYEFSEIGLFSAENNSLLTSAPDALMFIFSKSEGWTKQDSSEIISSTLPSGSDITTTENVIFVPAADPVLLTPDRYLQRSRIGEDALLIKGGFSDLATLGSPTQYTPSANYVSIVGTPINLSTARPDDEIKFSFSVLPKDYTEINNPTTGHPSTGVRLRIDFVHGTQYAAFEQTIPYAGLSTIIPANTEISSNGYFVVTKKMKELVYSTDFDWAAVNEVRLWADVDDTTPSNFFIAPDALRFESKNDNNPTYGLVAYSPVSNVDGAPQVKSFGLESQIEYKIPLEVL